MFRATQSWWKLEGQGVAIIQDNSSEKVQKNDASYVQWSTYVQCTHGYALYETRHWENFMNRDGQFWLF